MSLPDPAHTPLLDALFAHSDRYGFHMPGHAAGRAFPAWLKTAFGRLDSTEIPGLDDLNAPSGPLLVTMKKAASLYGAAATFLVTTGTTVSILAALKAASRHGRRLALPRAVHKSVVHAAALLDLAVTFLPGEADTAGAILPRLGENTALPSSIDLLLLTSPDYYGRRFDFAGLMSAAHAAGAAVVVDAAHGAHLAALDEDSAFDALGQGADLVAMSAHKTLPALTPCSLLHVAGGDTAAIRADEIAAALPLFQTSSPSLLLAASLEYAIDWLGGEGQASLRQAAARVEDLIGQLPDDISAVTSPGSDPLRLVLDVSATGRDGRDVAAFLRGRTIDIEMAEPCRLILIVSPFLPSAAFSALIQALHDLPRAPVTGEPAALAAAVSSCLCRPAPAVLPPRQALFGGLETRSIPLSEAAGRISAACLTPTPPCVPLVWPGERIEPETVELLTALERGAGQTVNVLA